MRNRNRMGMDKSPILPEQREGKEGWLGVAKTGWSLKSESEKQSN
jgi:hypothetical protein